MGIAGSKCLHPILLNVQSKKDSKFYGMVVGCGHCPTCRMQKAREWSLRIKMEAQDYDRGDICFTTLTYAPEFVPEKDSTLTLDPRDLQLFFKRLRRRLNYKVRMFSCGEYGSRTARPHYHSVIFGIKRKDWHFIEDAWKLGFVCNKDFYNETAGYVAQYIQKKLFGENVYGAAVPPFLRCSQNPSIGEDYFWRNASVICSQGFIVSDGYKHSIPRSFVRKAIDVGLLPENDLDDLQLIQNLKTVEFLDHVDAQGVELSDYERNFALLQQRAFDNSNRKRNYNEVV